MNIKEDENEKSKRLKSLVDYLQDKTPLECIQDPDAELTLFCPDFLESQIDTSWLNDN